MPVSYEECLAACIDCMEACNTCYGACLQEEQIKMTVTCIRMNRECTDLCA